MFNLNSVYIIVLLGAIATSNFKITVAQGTSVFSTVDVTRVSGTGADIKAAADKVCGSDLSAEELRRRHRLGDAAELQFFNRRILKAVDNEPLKKALNCQKNRNKVMKDTCELQWAIKTDNTCEIDDNRKQIASNIDAVDRTCTGADASLFVTVTGITKPTTPGPLDCGIKTNETFTSTFKDVNITKLPGTGKQALQNAGRVCTNQQSIGDLEHRAKLGSTANSSTFTPAITAAAANAPLLKALNCQKARNDIMISVCSRIRATKRNKNFNVKDEVQKIQKNIRLVDTYCPGVDVKLFI